MRHEDFVKNAVSGMKTFKRIRKAQSIGEMSAEIIAKGQEAFVNSVVSNMKASDPEAAEDVIYYLSSADPSELVDVMIEGITRKFEEGI